LQHGRIGAGTQGSQLQEIPPVERHVEDLAGGNHLTYNGRFRFEHGRDGGHCDLLVRRADFQRHVLRQILRDQERNAVGRKRLKSVFLNAQIVEAGREGREFVVTAFIALSRALQSGRWIGQDDCRAANHRFCSVINEPRDG
jgi:hypothetical protein